MSRTVDGPFYALAAAALFGGATAAAKSLLEDISPWMLAGLLYLGSGIGLGILVLLRSSRGVSLGKQSRLTRRELPWLAGAVVSGGMIAPLLLMWGLDRTPASTTSLLLNLEGVLTALLAWAVFRENIGSRVLGGLLAIIAGAALLSIAPEGGRDEGLSGRLAIIAACLCWAVDNNLTRRVSAGIPVFIAGSKGFVAGSVNVLIALSSGQTLPTIDRTAISMLVGFLGYGASLVLFVMALRTMGAARTGALFSTAPFIGAVSSLVFLHEGVGPMLVPAAILMGAGMVLQIGERHSHGHVHERLVHDHTHRHDEHHQHDHPAGLPVPDRHSHPHGP